MKILFELTAELTGLERVRNAVRWTKNMDAYLKCLQSNEHLIRFTRDNNIRSRELALEALDLDPDYSFGLAMLAWTYQIEVMLGWTNSPKESLEKAVDIGQKLEKM